MISKLKNNTVIHYNLYTNTDVDPTMLTVVDQWKPRVTRITNITIGRTAVELINTCRGEECNIGNLIADSFVYYVSNIELNSCILLNK